MLFTLISIHTVVSKGIDENQASIAAYMYQIGVRTLVPQPVFKVCFMRKEVLIT